MRIAFIALFSALTLLACSAPAQAANDVWDGNIPNFSNNQWGSGSNWVDDTTPGLNDTATLNFGSPIFAANPTAIQALTISGGNVSFTSSGGTRTLNVNSGGTQTTTVNTSLVLGSAGNPLHLNSTTLNVNGAGPAQFGTNHGSHATSTSLNVGTTGGGLVQVDGIGSELRWGGTANVGANGNSGELRFQNSASTGDASIGLVAGPLMIANSSVPGTTGLLSVESDADVFLESGMSIGTGTAGIGTVNVNGNGSSVSSTGFATTVGAASGGVGTINIGTTASGATFTAGSLTINATGAVNIGGETTIGALVAKGPILIDGGRITVNAQGPAASLSFDPDTVSKTMTVQNGGLADMAVYTTGFVTFNSHYFVSGLGSRWEGDLLVVDRHADFNVVAAGQLNVTQLRVDAFDFSPIFVADGAGTTVMCSTGVFGGGTTTFRNNASGTFTGGISVAGNVSVETGADLIANGVSMGFANMSVSGAGSTVTLTPGSDLSIAGGIFGAFFVVDDNAQFTVGPNDTTTTDVSTEFRVSNGGTFTTGNFVHSGQITAFSGGVIHADTLTLNPTGTFLCGPDNVVTDHLIFNGGTGSVVENSLPPLDITINEAVTLQNGAHLSFASGFTTQDNIVYTVTGTGSTIETLGASTFTINDGAQMIVTSGGLISAAADLVVGHATTGTGTVNIATGGTLSTGTTGGMTILATGAVNVGAGTNTGTLNANGDVNINGGTLTRGDHATFNLATDRTMTITNGGRASFTGNYTTAHDAVYNITGAGSLLQILAGNLIVNDGAHVNLSSGGAVDVSGAVIVAEEGTVQAGVSINEPIVGTSFDATINVAASGVSLGSAASFNGFNHQGVLNVGANTATLNSAAYARLGVLTTLAGGTINAPNGVYLSGGGNLVGNGTVSARVTGDSGSVIEASGALALGDAASPAGFNYDGELRTRQFAVTLNSSTQAGLGTLTTLGNGASAGTLNSTNGYFIDFAEALTGFGTVNSTNTLAKRAVINGTVEGNSALEPITLSGYIKGVGSFDNVTFTGTFDPGLSPTLLTAGNLTFAVTSGLIIELGGLARGTAYDAIAASGQLALDGTLQILLTGGYSPSVGNSFDILDWASISGTFNTLSLPALGAGLMWNASQLYSTGTLRVNIAGDYNSNGIVDAADYVVWRKSVGQTGVGLAADGNINNQIDSGDFDTWRAHFGQTAGSGASVTTAAVPEPKSLALLLLAAVFHGIRPSRR